jgi:glycine/D-amino acid oxidase-like deaminating enzyme
LRFGPGLEDEVWADVCVVGLGGSGLTCIGALLDRRLQVVGLDAKTVAGGAAGRNGGFLRAGMAAPYHQAAARLGRERACRLYHLTMAEVARIAAETPEAVRRTGTLRVATAPGEAADCTEQLAALRDDHFPVEAYRGPEGEGLLFPADCAMNPLLRCRMLASRAITRGARLFEMSPSENLADGEVVTPGGRVRCSLVIVAVDGGLEVALPELTGRVRSARLQMLATAPQAACWSRPVSTRHGWEYWQQLEDGRITLGGFRDQGGDDEWGAPAEPTDRVQALLEGFLRTRLGSAAPVTHRWAARAAWTLTGLPLLEEVRPGVWAIGGYCGAGNAIGALCGRAVAELAVTGRSELAALLVPPTSTAPSLP